MKTSKCVVSFLIFSFLIFSQSHAQWFQLYSGVSTYLSSIQFVNYNTGWTIGDSGKILKTTNGGTNWAQQTSNNTYPLRSVQFLDANEGWTAGGIMYMSYPLNIIEHTTNGGIDWNTVIGIGDAYSVYTLIFFLNSMTGFVGGSGSTGFSSRGFIGKTTSGGLNWTFVSSNIEYACFSIRFVDSQIGFVTARIWNDVGVDTGFVLKTTNGGSNWIAALRVYGVTLRSISCPGPGSIYAAGTYSTSGIGVVFRSTDGGSNWSSVEIWGTAGLSTVYFANLSTGWVGALVGSIFRSTNVGSSWQLQYTAPNASVNSIFFADVNTGWAACSNGIILKTTNGGETGISPVSNEVPNEFSLYQNSPNPFNPVTRIRFDIPANVKRETGNVKIIVFDVLGRETSTLVNEKLKPGAYEVEWDATNFPSGLYFYKLEVGDYLESKKMILIK